MTCLNENCPGKGSSRRHDDTDTSVSLRGDETAQPLVYHKAIMDKPTCPTCDTPLVFRSWSHRRPAKSEALAECPGCGGKWQIRYWQGRPTSEPYQVRQKAVKTAAVNGRTTQERKAAIIAVYGSVQKFIDTAPLVCIALQLKH